MTSDLIPDKHKVFASPAYAAYRTRKALHDHVYHCPPSTVEEHACWSGEHGMEEIDPSLCLSACRHCTVVHWCEATTHRWCPRVIGGDGAHICCGLTGRIISMDAIQSVGGYKEENRIWDLHAFGVPRTAMSGSGSHGSAGEGDSDSIGTYDIERDGNRGLLPYSKLDIQAAERRANWMSRPTLSRLQRRVVDNMRAMNRTVRNIQLQNKRVTARGQKLLRTSASHIQAKSRGSAKRHSAPVARSVAMGSAEENDDPMEVDVDGDLDRGDASPTTMTTAVPETAPNLTVGWTDGQVALYAHMGGGSLAPSPYADEERQRDNSFLEETFFKGFLQSLPKVDTATAVAAGKGTISLQRLTERNKAGRPTTSSSNSSTAGESEDEENEDLAHPRGPTTRSWRTHALPWVPILLADPDRHVDSDIERLRRHLAEGKEKHWLSNTLMPNQRTLLDLTTRFVTHFEGLLARTRPTSKAKPMAPMAYALWCDRLIALHNWYRGAHDEAVYDLKTGVTAQRLVLALMTHAFTCPMVKADRVGISHYVWLADPWLAACESAGLFTVENLQNVFAFLKSCGRHKAAQWANRINESLNGLPLSVQGLQAMLAIPLPLHNRHYTC